MSSCRSLLAGQSPTPRKDVNYHSGARTNRGGSQKPFIVNKPAKLGKASNSSNKQVINNSSSRITTQIKNFSMSTRQNTLESVELDKISQVGNHMHSELRKISVRKQPVIGNTIDSIKSKLANPCFSLPRVDRQKRTFVRADTEVLKADLPMIDRVCAGSFTKLKARKACLQKNGEQYSECSLADGRSRGSRPSKVTFDVKENYYHSGLAKYVQTKDPRYAHYYNHILKSHFSLREIKSDYFPEHLKRGEFLNFRRKNNLVLALDLDETLIHCCNFDPPEKQRYQYAINYCSDKGAFITAKINLRPHLHQFLASVSTYYDVVIYTASEREYALSIVNFIDPQRKYISDVFHRDNCIRTKKGFVVKDLRVVLPDELDRIVLVDNSSHCFAPQLTNGIPITSFTYDEADRELLHLRDFLMDMRHESNIRQHLTKYFSLTHYSKHLRTDDLIAYLTADNS